MPARSQTPEPTQPTPEPPTVLAGILAQDEVYEPNKREVSADIIQWADTAYNYWLNNRDKWRAVPFPDQKTLAENLADLQYYCREVRDIPLTVQLRNGADGEPIKDPSSGETVGYRLVYRVRDKVKSGRPSGR